MPKRTCQIEGCARLYRARGFCSAHLNRLDRYGDPEGGLPVFHGDRLKWILSLLDREPTMECIEWPWATSGQGYGMMSLNGKSRNAHAAVLMIRSGLEQHPEGWVACHMPVICHNRSCVNPLHLRWDTVAGNLADRIIDDTNTWK